MYIYENINPAGKNVDDCVIRAIATVTGQTWDEVFLDLEAYAFLEKDLPNSNVVWGKYLIDCGFSRRGLPDTCPICYTVRDFVRDHRAGIYVVGDGQHVIAVVDGYYIDAGDRGDMPVLFYYEKR